MEVELFGALRELGAIAALAWIIVQWLRGKLYSDNAVSKMEASYEARMSEQEAHYEARLIEVRTDRQEWKDLALEGLALAEHSTNVTEQAATAAARVTGLRGHHG